MVDVIEAAHFEHCWTGKYKVTILFVRHQTSYMVSVRIMIMERKKNALDKIQGIHIHPRSEKTRDRSIHHAACKGENRTLVSIELRPDVF